VKAFCSAQYIKLFALHVPFAESLLARYLNAHAFTELHLDSIFKYGDDNILPLEVNLLIFSHITN